MKTAIRIFLTMAVIALLTMQRVSFAAQSIDPKSEFVTIHLHPEDDIVGVTNGFVFETYTLDFDLVNQFTILNDTSIPLNQYSFQWSPDGSKLAVFLSGVPVPPINTILQIWDIATTQKLYEIPGAGGISSFAWSPDGARFATSITTNDLTTVARVYDAQTGEMLVEIPSSAISQLAWSPSGNQLVFEWPSAVQVWSADTGQPLRTLDARMDSERGLASSPTQNLVAFVNLNDGGNILEIWNTDTGQLIHQLLGHTKPITGFQWSQGGLVSTGLDDTIRIWNTETGQEVRAFQVGRYPYAELNADGTRLLVRDKATGIHVRDAVTGDILAVFGSLPTPTLTPSVTGAVMWLTSARNFNPVSA